MQMMLLSFVNRRMLLPLHSQVVAINVYFCICVRVYCFLNSSWESFFYTRRGLRGYQLFFIFHIFFCLTLFYVQNRLTNLVRPKPGGLEGLILQHIVIHWSFQQQVTDLPTYIRRKNEEDKSYVQLNSRRAFHIFYSLASMPLFFNA